MQNKIVFDKKISQRNSLTSYVISSHIYILLCSKTRTLYFLQLS